VNLTDDQLDQALTDALRGLRMDDFTALAAESDRREAERNRRLSAPDALASAAAWYAAQGIPVFPLRPGEKIPLAGSRGFKDATTDPATVRTWWTRVPQANIGLPTGGQFDVIDVDGPAGYQSMADLREQGKLPEIIGKAYTPRGGRHLYVPPSGDGNAANFLPGLDYRGAGGYVLAPPSVGPNGKRYDWIIPLRLGAAG
jgi:hypothetical protein